MSPAAVKTLLVAALLTVCGGFGWAAVSTYRNAIERAQTAEQDAENLRATVKDRDDALAGWVTRQREWEADRRLADAALKAKEDERRAQAEAFAKSIKEFRYALSILDEADRACAARAVPAAVDRLLDESAEAAPAR